MVTSQDTERACLALPYYHGLMARDDVKDMLKKNGQFLIRMSEPTAPSAGRAIIISIMVQENGTLPIKHIVIRTNEEGKYQTDNHSFTSIGELVSYYLSSKDFIHPTVQCALQFPVCRFPWELDHSEVRTTTKLGKGAYGEVMMGTLKKKGSHGPPINVAVKMAKLDVLTKEQIKEVTKEARLMRSFEHPNIVKFYGIAAGTEPLMVVMELADSGSLDSFLSKNTFLPPEKRVEMCAQAAWGVEYLHVARQVMHCDLAARNCLYGEGRVKISDFGLAKEGTVYHMEANKRVPIRWLAPEILKTAVYSPKTDVWAFGVMCWEIFAGMEPYPGMVNSEVSAHVLNGYRMQFTPNCSYEFAQFLCSRCWTENANDRANMSEIATRLEVFSGQTKPPLVVSMKHEMVPEILPVPRTPPMPSNGHHGQPHHGHHSNSGGHGSSNSHGNRDSKAPSTPLSADSDGKSGKKSKKTKMMM